MGNWCLSYEIDQKPTKRRCKKCKDKFVVQYGGKSERNSCRYHNYIIYNNQYYCNICNKFKSEVRSRNCYHTIYNYNK
jgi:hypothetical protein